MSPTFSGACAGDAAGRGLVDVGLGGDGRSADGRAGTAAEKGGAAEARQGTAPPLTKHINLDKGIDPNTPLKDALEFLA